MKQLVTNGDFTDGNKGFHSDYDYINDRNPPSEFSTPDYHVNTDPTKVYDGSPEWASFGDHTTGDGKMMICDGGSGDVWREGITLKAGHEYDFSLWARVMNDDSGGNDSPRLQFLADGVAIGVALTVVGEASAGWQLLSFSYTPTDTTKKVSIQDLNHDYSYNDFALDDISITTKRHGGGDTSAAGAFHNSATDAHLGLHPAFGALHGAEHLAIA